MKHNLTRRHLLIFGATVPALIMAGPAFCAQSAIYKNGNTAINGFDPVAYFTMSKAIEGTADNAMDWNGATWYFSSQQTKDTFAANPIAYAPQYGGYCAYAVSRGYTASTSPYAWSVYEDKLYLNYSKVVRTLWGRDIPGNIKSGDANWPAVLS